MERVGLDPRESSLEIGVFGAEPWTQAMREEIEQRAGMHATDIYGLSEVMGPGVAQECVETKDGLHIWEDHFYPEIVNPLTDEPVEDGQVGELVFTPLTKQAMPVLRYRTRDLTKLMPGTARPGFRRMEKVTGRTDDLMIVRGVNVFPTQIEEIVLAEEGLTPYFQCVLTRPGRMDELTVNVEAEPTVSEPTRAEIARRLKHDIKSRIGTTATVNVVEPGGVERSVGKARRIVDHRSR
jgi:phenylacetate-CoA ligase